MIFSILQTLNTFRDKWQDTYQSLATVLDKKAPMLDSFDSRMGSRLGHKDVFEMMRLQPLMDTILDRDGGNG